MALIHLHKVMIGAALLFSGMFAVRAFVVGDMVMGGVFVAVTAGLGGYFRWFLQNKAQVSEE